MRHSFTATCTDGHTFGFVLADDAPQHPHDRAVRYAELQGRVIDTLTVAVQNRHDGTWDQRPVRSREDDEAAAYSDEMEKAHYAELRRQNIAH